MTDRMLTRQLDRLWLELRQTIDATYRVERESKPTAIEAAISSDAADVLRDYVENQSMHDALLDLLKRESENERRHRAVASGKPPISTVSAAKLLLLTAFANGSKLECEPSARTFILQRKTYAEASYLGYLLRGRFHPKWLEEVAGLDYSGIMSRVRNALTLRTA